MSPIGRSTYWKGVRNIGLTLVLDFQRGGYKVAVEKEDEI